MRNLLIPTDLTCESLQLIEYAILNVPNEKLNIHLVHGYKLPEFRWSLLQFSKKHQAARLMKKDFKKTIENLKKEHASKINDIEVHVLYGNSLEEFRSFIDQLNIKTAVIGKSVESQKSSNRSFSTIKYILKTVNDVIEVPFTQTETSFHPYFSFANVFKP